ARADARPGYTARRRAVDTKRAPAAWLTKRRQCSGGASSDPEIKRAPGGGALPTCFRSGSSESDVARRRIHRFRMARGGSLAAASVRLLPYPSHDSQPSRLATTQL